MPTPKQVRAHMIKISKAYRNLSTAIRLARDAGVINYKTEDTKELSPLTSLYEVDSRIEKTTEQTILSAYRSEIRKQTYGY